MRFAFAIVAALLIGVCSTAADVGFPQIEIPRPAKQALSNWNLVSK
jgi:hypothetical protein